MGVKVMTHNASFHRIANAPGELCVMFQIIQGNRFTRVTGRGRHILMQFIKKDG